jgi:hypothetical protein
VYRATKAVVARLARRPRTALDPLTAPDIAAVTAGLITRWPVASLGVRPATTVS